MFSMDVTGLEYKLIRTRSAGVFAGYLKSEKETKAGKEVELLNVRRIWYWDGAASLSQLAVNGTSKPDKCQFPIEVPKINLPEVIEIVDVTEKARKSIASVKVWSV
jgi:hypothetical protein